MQISVGGSTAFQVFQIGFKVRLRMDLARGGFLKKPRWWVPKPLGFNEENNKIRWKNLEFLVYDLRSILRQGNFVES